MARDPCQRIVQGSSQKKAYVLYHMCRRIQYSPASKRTINANNATHYVKLGKKRRESSKRNYYIRVSQVFLNTCMRVGGGIGSGVCFSLFMVSACYWRGRLCFGRGRDRGFVLYFSLFLRVLGWCVCVCACIRAYTHTNYLGT